MIGTVLSIRERGVMIGTSGPGKGRQVDISTDANGVDQRLEQGIIRVWVGMIEGLILYVGCGELNPRG